MYDAIIIGARVAGASTAMLLARHGYKVLLLDRDNFPSDTISTHIIFCKGVTQLKKWGLYEKIMATGCPVIRHVAFDLGPMSLVGKPAMPANGINEIITPRRIYLDKIMVDAAVDAGAELRENCYVEEIIKEGDRVTGVRYTTGNGNTVIEKAKIVIGADGRNSILAHAVQADVYNAVPKLTCWYYAYWSGVPIDALTMYSRPYRAMGVIPTNDNLACITVTWPADEFVQFRTAIESNYLASLMEVEALAEIIPHAKRETPFTGMADLPNFFRKPYGPGWALVGDASYHKDPITGQGISDAFVRAERLVEAINAGFSGIEDLEVALSRYQFERDEESMPMYSFTCDFANLAPPPPEMEALFTALYYNQEATDQFIGALSGTVPMTSFFAPGNIERIIMAHQAASQ